MNKLKWKVSMMFIDAIHIHAEKKEKMRLILTFTLIGMLDLG